MLFFLYRPNCRSFAIPIHTMYLFHTFASQSVKFLLSPLLLFGYFSGQAQSVVAEEEWAVSSQWGLQKPAHFVPNSPNPAFGLSINYNKLHAYPDANTQKERYARIGVLFQTYTFRNPAVLGGSVGLALTYEPVLITYRRFALSAVLLAGVSYVTHHHDPITNPDNTAIGSALNGLTGAGLNIRYTLSPHWRLLGGIDYKHLSNAGVRPPNQGLNLPSVTLGLSRYVSRPIPNRSAPVPTSAAPLRKRWMARFVVLGAIRILEATDQDSAQGYPIYGLNALIGYRVWRNHTLSAGLEGLDDRSFKEQLRRWTGTDQPYRQLTILAGYEYWAGPIGLTIHNGWNIVRPPGYKPATYQKYGLLFKTPIGLTTGVAVKAYGGDTKNIQLLLGYSF